MSYPLPILRIILLGLLVSLTLGWSGLAQAETCFGLPDTDPNVCSGVGSCVGPDICACDVGYVGSECDTWTCSGLTNTDPNVCSGNGVCTAPDACACDVGYVGLECDTWSCSGLTNTDPNVCSGNGACTAPDACVCDVGYVGSECELSAVPATSPLGLALIMGLLTMASAVAIRHSLRTL